MPGGFTSMLNDGLPVTMAGLSTPGTRVPRILKSFGSFSLISVTAIGGIDKAACAKEGYVALRPERVCVTTPDSVVSSDSGTFSCFAAVAIIIIRAAAPTFLIGV